MKSQQNIPFPLEFETELFSRVREAIEMEVAGNIISLYEFTVPTIRAKRIAERIDEPALSLGEIAEFVKRIKTAEVLAISVEEYIPSLERHGGWPAAIVNSSIRYNNYDHVSRFRTIWVRVDTIWHTTSLGKFGFWQ